MGAGVARALGRGRAVLLKNHGVVVTGASIAEAVIGTIMLENGAMVQLLAEAAGEVAPEFPRDDIVKLKARHQPARAVSDQFRLSGAAGEARRQIITSSRQEYEFKIASKRPARGQSGAGAAAS